MLNKIALYVGFAGLLVIAFAVGGATTRRIERAVEAAPALTRAEGVAPVVTSWKLTETEAAALNGNADHFNRYGLAWDGRGWRITEDGEIARVSSGSEIAARVIASMVLQSRAIGRQDVILAIEARRSRGLPESVALVQSVNTWVEAGK